MQRILSMEHWSPARKIIFRFVAVFVLLFINSFSFPHRYIPDIGKYTSYIFEAMVVWCAENILALKQPYTSALISDSTGMYLNTIILLFISLIICLLWTLLEKKGLNYNMLFYWFRTGISYYLAMQLFAYGFSKIFKWQFYLPEPNILFTYLGDVPRDLLFWSSMGSSRPYTMFTGFAEVSIALLLLFRRTRLLGGLLAAGILTNVLMINLCFDISVKLYSAFLLLLSLIIAAPEAKRLWDFFIWNKPSQAFLWEPTYETRKHRLYLSGKTFIILFILADALAGYVAANNFNDDKAERPKMHGAYSVNTFVKNQDTLKPLMTDTLRWKRIFVHRRDYLIIQGMDDRMEDYSINYDTIHRELIIEDYNSNVITLKYSHPNDSTLLLNGNMNGNTLEVSLKKINLSQLPLLQNEFHWTSDF
jgi:hypothetical protein